MGATALLITASSCEQAKQIFIYSFKELNKDDNKSRKEPKITEWIDWVIEHVFSCHSKKKKERGLAKK